MLQEGMLIVITVILTAFVIWLFLPIAYVLYSNILIQMNPLVPENERQTWEYITELWYNVVRYVGLIVLAAVAYYLWTVAQRKKAEDLIGG